MSLASATFQRPVPLSYSSSSLGQAYSRHYWLTPPLGPLVQIRHNISVSVRRLSPASKDDRLHGKELEHSELWTVPEPAPLRLVKEKDSRNIVAGDLYATLEAHRGTNRAAVIRKVHVRPEPEYFVEELSSLGTGFPTSERRVRLSDNRLAAGSGVAKHDKNARADVKMERQQPSATSIKLKRDKHKILFSRETSNANNVPTRPKAVVRALVSNWMPNEASHGLRRPWTWDKEQWTEESWDMTSRERLTAELQGFLEWIASTRQEEVATQELIQSVTQVIQRHFPNCNVSVHGSRATGLHEAISDIDLCVTIPMLNSDPWGRGPSASHPEAKKYGEKIISRLGDAFSMHERFSDLELVRARFPMLRVKDALTSLEIQIVVNASIVPARETTLLLLDEVPHSKAIYHILRQMLKLRGLNSVYEGGVGSYTLLMMVIAALKSPHEPVDRDDLVGRLHKVLRFWMAYKPTETLICVDPSLKLPKWKYFLASESPTDGFGSSQMPYLVGAAEMSTVNRRLKTRYMKAQKLKKSRKSAGEFKWHPGMLSLQDPADPSNDLGIKSHKFDVIQETLGSTAKMTFARMSRWNKESAEQRAARGHHLADVLLLADWGEYLNRRKKLRAAASVLDYRSAVAIHERDLVNPGKPQGRQAYATSWGGRTVTY